MVKIVNYIDVDQNFRIKKIDSMLRKRNSFVLLYKQEYSKLCIKRQLRRI